MTGPQDDTSPERLLQRLRDRWPPRVVDVDGTSAQYIRTEGAGLPVIWLHGAAGTADVFFRQLLAWGDGHDHVAITLPPWPDAPQLAGFLARFADVLGIARFDLVGTSLGGHVAQWVAATQAGRLRRLVLGNTFRDPAPLQSAERLQSLERASDDAVAHEMLERFRAMPDGELRRVLPVLLSTPQAARALRSRLLAVQRATVVPRLAIADENVLVIDCGDDPLMPAAVRQDLRAAHPSARAIEVRGGGHYPYLLQPAAYNDAIRNFLGT